MNVGTLLCVDGEFSAQAPNLERAAILAQEWINGSTRVFPDVAVEDIPCRSVEGDHGCGVFVGTTAEGEVLRGPLQLRTANTEGRVDRGVAAARQLQEQFEPTVYIGPCQDDVMREIFAEVTLLDALMVTPAVTSDEISDLADQDDADLPGFLLRTVTPNYIQAQMLARIGINRVGGNPLIRLEDQSDVVCTTDPSKCDEEFPDGDHECVPLRGGINPLKEYLDPAPNECGDEVVGFCDVLGPNYECLAPEAGGPALCTQFRISKVCARVAQPETTIILHQNTEFGEGLAEEIIAVVADTLGNHVLRAEPFDPLKPDEFPDRIRMAFEAAANELDRLQGAGDLPDDYQFRDTTVFLLAEAADGVLLLQEWSLQVQNQRLPAGSAEVFWVGPNTLRSALLTNQLPFDTMRNLYVGDPSTLTPNNRDFFEELYRARWGGEPEAFAGNVFDAVVLVALAAERAGFLDSQAGGEVGPAAAADLKNAYVEVATGCVKKLTEDCPGAVTTFPFSKDYFKTLLALAAGDSVRWDGVTGDLSLTLAGDRLNELAVWSVGQEGVGTQFVFVNSYAPNAFAIRLRK